MTKSTIAGRQGDVLLVRVDSIPDGATRVTKHPVRGRIVLAYGEATGHHHSVAVKDAEMLETAEAVFLRIREGATCEEPVYRTYPWANQFGRGLKYAEQIGTRPVPGTPLEHQEHATIVLEPGDYQVVRQVEYTPEAIRTVAD